MLVEVSRIHGIPSIQFRDCPKVNEPIHLDSLPEVARRMSRHPAANFSNALQFRGNLTIQGLDSSRNPVGEACQVLDGNYFAREYHFRAGLASLDVDNNLDNDPTISVIEDATRIYNSATAVVHLIDKHLPFEEIMGLTNTQN